MSEISKTEIGLAMKRAREHRGLTQAQLADAADISEATIKGWEQGNGSQLCLALIAAQTLNLTLSQYIGEEPLE